MLAWGAVDAIHPNEHRKQVAFRVDYSGGWSSFGSDLWKDFRNVCKPTHVELTWLVTACRAPDGSFWALQSWQRGLRDYGVPSTGLKDDWELRLSHWTGELPKLEVGIGWAYRRFHSLFGRYTWRGQGVYGFSATTQREPARHVRAQPLRRHARLRVREGLVPREQLPEPQGHGRVLLRLLLLTPRGRRAWASATESA